MNPKKRKKRYHKFLVTFATLYDPGLVGRRHEDTRRLWFREFCKLLDEHEEREKARALALRNPS